MPDVLEQPTPVLRRGSGEFAPWILVLCGLAAMYGPTFYDLFTGLWSTDEQGHGPIVLAISLWLIYRRWTDVVFNASDTPRVFIGVALVVLAALCFAIGRSQGIQFFEAGSLVPMLAAVVLALRGPNTLKSIWFALFFMLFMIPLPGALVDAVTQPMKLAVSYVAELLLFTAGYPIARTGVMLQIGPYQLLVADACAGLHTLFTLEALGLLYLNAVRHASVFRNVALAILIVPISFAANVIRVVVLTLVTYHLGDEAGQGFLHGFAGMVLFLSALLLIVGADSILRILRRIGTRSTAG